MWKSWVTDLVSNYTIDGLRIDSAYEVDQAFFAPFQNAAGIYMVGEVDDNEPSVVCPYQKYMSGTLNYPTWHKITQAFESTSGDMAGLAGGVNKMKSTCADTTLLGSFLENHDQPRFPSLTSDMALAKNAIAFTMLQDGIPIIYEGQEQHYSGGKVPDNREAIWLSGYNTNAELYQWIASLNQIRNQAIYVDGSYVTWKAEIIYSNDTTIAMRKGATGLQMVSVFSNRGSGSGSYSLTLKSGNTGFAADEALVEVLGCTSHAADSSGDLKVVMASGLPRVFYPASKLSVSAV